MSTDNDFWRNSSDEEQTSGSRDGNRFYNNEGGYNRGSRYGERREGGRPRFSNNGQNNTRPRYGSQEGGYGNRNSYSNREGDSPRYSREGGYNNREDQRGGQRGYNNNRSYRPRFNNDNENGGNEFHNDRAFRPRFSNNSDNYQRRSYDDNRSYRPRFNREGGEDRPQRGGYNQRDGEYNNRRPRFNKRTTEYDPNAKYSKKKQMEYKNLFVDENEPIRLNKFLANAGICSRREADEFIMAGVVSVNGEVVTELGTKIKRSDEVKFHDQTVSIEKKVYVLLNKPKDTVTTTDDPKERRTVMDLVKDACSERIYPVGRLDRNTTGVLLLTNDGDLASKLTHPKFLKKKIYHVHLDKNLTRADMEQIAAGIELEDGEIHADAISYTDEDKKDNVGIEIHSGKNRIVRRIFESLGYKVLKLDRVYFAGLTKKSLRRGDWRYLTEKEVNFLKMGSFE